MFSSLKMRGSMKITVKCSNLLTRAITEPRENCEKCLAHTVGFTFVACIMIYIFGLINTKFIHVPKGRGYRFSIYSGSN